MAIAHSTVYFRLVAKVLVQDSVSEVAAAMSCAACALARARDQAAAAGTDELEIDRLRLQVEAVLFRLQPD